MTEARHPVDPQRELIAQWRHQSLVAGQASTEGDGTDRDEAIADSKRQCADELEAVLVRSAAAALPMKILGAPALPPIVPLKESFEALEALAAAAPREEPARKFDFVKAMLSVEAQPAVEQLMRDSDVSHIVAADIAAARGEEPAPQPDRRAFEAGWRATKADDRAGDEEDIADAPDVAFLDYRRSIGGEEPAPPPPLTLAEYDALVIAATQRLSVADQNEIIARDGRLYEKGYDHGKHVARTEARPAPPEEDK